MPIDRLVVDSTAAATQLCKIGASYGADKSPYNPAGHRHPYTAIYTMLFAPLKYRPVRFAEIGTAGGASACMWVDYFKHPETQIRMFDRDETFLANCREGVGAGTGEMRLTAELMDVGVDGDVVRALRTSSEEYDVILDDSSHDFDHQVRIVREAFPLLKRGGMLIIEDIFRSENLERYEAALAAELAEATAVTCIDCEHALRWSPGWENDRLLVIVR